MFVQLFAQWASFYFFAIAALIHVGFFIFQSFWLQKDQAQSFLKISASEHQAIKVWAFNQGFYNLFLAAGVLIGLYFVLKLQVMMAGVMTSFAGVCMIIAGVVLWFSSPKLRKFAYLQALPPFLGFVFLAFHII